MPVACELVDSHAILTGTCCFLRKYSRGRVIVRRSSIGSRGARPEVQLNSHQNESESVVKARRGTAPPSGYCLIVSVSRGNFKPRDFPACKLYLVRSITFVPFEGAKTTTSSFFLSSLLARYEIPTGGENFTMAKRRNSILGRRTTRKAIIDDYYSAWRPSGSCRLSRPAKIKVLRAVHWEKKEKGAATRAPRLFSFRSPRAGNDLPAV